MKTAFTIATGILFRACLHLVAAMPRPVPAAAGVPAGMPAARVAWTAPGRVPGAVRRARPEPAFVPRARTTLRRGGGTGRGDRA